MAAVFISSIFLDHRRVGLRDRWFKHRPDIGRCVSIDHRRVGLRDQRIRVDGATHSRVH